MIRVSKFYLVFCFSILSLLSFFFLPKTVFAANFYVSTTGSSSGDGSIENPWDIQTALNHPSPVQPGDTIWVRGGTYTGQFTPRLQGAEGAPIILRAHPGEHVVFDTQTPAGSGNNPNFQQARHHRWWGMEITNTRTADKGGGFILKSRKSNMIINSVIHDLGNNTFGNGDDIYGSIIYNNGNYENKLGHHLYTQNPNNSRDANGDWAVPRDPLNDPAIVEDSIIFQSFAFGMHGYSGGSGRLENIHMIGSVWFNNGYASSGTGGKKDDILIGGNQNHYFNRMIENMTWAKGTTSERTAGLGRYGDYTCDFDIIDNYLIGLTRFHNNWDDPTHCAGYSNSEISGNTFGSYTHEGDDPVTGPNNIVLSSAPTQNRIFIRENQYEDDRAHIVVYNWEDQDTVNVDVGGVLETGDPYEVRNGQNFFAPPVLSGTYNGEQLALPMDAGFNPAQPISPGEITTAEMTGREFNLFVVMPPLEYDAPAPGDPTSTPAATATPTTIPVSGDANDDGTVDGLDYVIWLNNYNNSTDNGVSDGDFNNDSTVDGLDYVIWLNNYNA